MSTKNPILNKLVSLDETMDTILKKVAAERKIAPKRLMESWIITGLLKDKTMTLKQADTLLNRQAKLMEKKKWLYK